MYCTGHRKSAQTLVICMCVLKHVYRVKELQLPLHVFYLLFVCLFCCFCFVCVSHDEVSKPRSMQLIDLEVMSSTAEMSVLKCYHNRMQQRRGSIFLTPEQVLPIRPIYTFLFSVLFFCYSVFYHPQSDDNFTALPVILSWKYYSSFGKQFSKS